MAETAVLLKIEFKNLPKILVSTSPYDVVISGEKYKSVGDVIDISKSRTTRGIKTSPTKITLAGEASEYITAINSNAYVGGRITIIIADLGLSGDVLSSYPISSGLMDKPKISRSTTSVKTTIDIIPKMILFDRAVGTFPIDALQQALSPEDTIFSGAIAAKKIKEESNA